MNMFYEYRIDKVDEAARCMEVVYTAPGRSPIRISAR